MMRDEFLGRLGELLSCYVLGGVLLVVIPRLSFFRSRLPADKL